MIILKSPSELARMRQAGRIVAGVLTALQERGKPGINTVCLGRETFGDQSNCVY